VCSIGGAGVRVKIDLVDDRNYSRRNASVRSLAMNETTNTSKALGALVAPRLVALLAPLRCLRRRGADDRASPFHSSKARTTALPFPWSRHERRSRPCGCGAVRTRDSARTRRIRGGMVVSIASAFHRASNAAPGGMKGRGPVGDGGRRKHRSEARSATSPPSRAGRGLSFCLWFRSLLASTSRAFLCLR